MTSSNAIRLTVPHQNLDKCSFFECTEKGVNDWVTGLPMANLGQTTRQLYHALEEINRVRLTPNDRMIVLEALRKPTHFVSNGLAKHYLNQPIVLPDQPRKVTELANSMHELISTGYRTVAAHAVALGKKSVRNFKLEVAVALHRAITDITLNIQRHYQLYNPVDEGLWLKLHQLHTLGIQQNVVNHAVKDREFGDGTVAEAYIKALLIGCSKPNQLRQEDFSSLLGLLNKWSKLCHLGPIDDQSILILNQDKDHPPIYRSKCDDNDLAVGISLDTSRLIEHLLSLREESTNSLLIVDGDSVYTVSRDLLSHLILSWGSMSKRNFMRLEANGELDLCIGLSSTHHFIANEMSFELLLKKNESVIVNATNDNPFLKTQTRAPRVKDVWDSAYENTLKNANISLESIDYHIGKNAKNAAKKDQKTFISNHVHMINSSVQGYCIEWPEDIAAQLKTGEIVGVKDSKSTYWSTAVIRWVDKGENEQIQIGLELISPNALPYGARVISKVGEQSQYMRVLILPEMPVLNRPVTLLTAILPFREGQKIILNQGGKEAQAKLGKKLNSQGAYSQFELIDFTSSSLHVQTNEVKEEEKSDDSFGSIWKNL